LAGPFDYWVKSPCCGGKGNSRMLTPTAGLPFGAS
jgi:hypothetical protein